VDDIRVGDVGQGGGLVVRLERLDDLLGFVGEIKLEAYVSWAAEDRAARTLPAPRAMLDAVVVLLSGTAA
jgi:hypothetical protein